MRSHFHHEFLEQPRICATTRKRSRNLIDGNATVQRKLGCFSDRLKTIFLGLTQIIQQFSPTEMAVEQVFMAMSDMLRQAPINPGERADSAVREDCWSGDVALSRNMQMMVSNPTV